MLIGVDATCWSNGRGYGRHARALLRALVDLDAHNQYTFFFDADPAGVAPGLPASVRLHWVRSSVPAVLAAAAQGRRSLRDMWRMSWAISRADLDVVLFPTIYSYVPVWGRARKVVMIHDVIAEKFPHLTVPSRRARLAWRAKVALGIRQADAIATVSAYSRGHILEHFGLAPERVSVVGEASDAIFRTLDHPSLTPRLLDAGIHPEGRSILYVGGFGPHKNLPTLLAAFAELASQPGFSDVQLILVGEHTSEVFYTHVDAIRQRVAELGLTDRTVFTGYLTDEELVVLLNLSTVLVLPSWMEGFGLPAIEAAACGCPSIATTASPLPELLGAGGLYVDPGQPPQLRKALTRVLTEPKLRHTMRQAGLAAAQRLTWTAAARQMHDVLAGVAAYGAA